MDPLVVGNKFRIGQEIAHGSFGHIYRGTNMETGEGVAFKLEPVKTRHPQLLYEARLYKILNTGGCAIGIPMVWWYGTCGDFNVMVMEFLGPSLEDFRNWCGLKFSLKTTLMLAEQMISRLEFVHRKNFLYRDIKPDNFVMGTGKKGHHVYLIDFGLAKKFRNPQTHQHIPYKDGKGLVGTVRYCSINTHLGIEQSCRDDLEAVGYVLVYFLRGSLPWQGLRARTTQQKYDLVSKKKMETPVEEICRGIPSEFAAFINHCRSLGFEGKPDYASLRKSFRDLFVREGYQMDYVYDWTIKRNEPLNMDMFLQEPKAASSLAVAPGSEGEKEAPVR